MDRALPGAHDACRIGKPHSPVCWTNTAAAGPRGRRRDEREISSAHGDIEAQARQHCPTAKTSWRPGWRQAEYEGVMPASSSTTVRRPKGMPPLPRISAPTRLRAHVCRDATANSLTCGVRLTTRSTSRPVRDGCSTPRTMVAVANDGEDSPKVIGREKTNTS